MESKNIYFTLDMLYKLTLEGIEKIDAEYWTKCVDHMLKEVDYYMQLDGLTPPVDETAAPNLVTEETVQSHYELPLQEFEPPMKKRRIDSQTKDMIVKKCLNDLVSPAKIAHELSCNNQILKVSKRVPNILKRRRDPISIPGCNAQTVRRYVLNTGEPLPKKYRETHSAIKQLIMSENEVI